MSEEQATPVFEWNDKKFKVELTMLDALQVLPDKFGIKVLGIFSDEAKVEEAMRTLVFEDERTLQLMFYYVQKQDDMLNFEDFIKKVENLSAVDKFRDAFWSAVVLFSGPLKRQALMEIWKIFKQELKKLDLEKSNSSA